MISNGAHLKSETEQPLEMQVKLALVEWAKDRLLKEDYTRIRREIRRDPSIKRDTVTALIDAGDRAREKSEGPYALPARVTL